MGESDCVKLGVLDIEEYWKELIVIQHISWTLKNLIFHLEQW